MKKAARGRAVSLVKKGGNDYNENAYILMFFRMEGNYEYQSLCPRK